MSLSSQLLSERFTTYASMPTFYSFITRSTSSSVQNCTPLIDRSNSVRPYLDDRISWDGLASDLGRYDPMMAIHYFTAFGYDDRLSLESSPEGSRVTPHFHCIPVAPT